MLPAMLQTLLLAFVGAGLLANAVGQSIFLLLTRRFREQARSHTSPNGRISIQGLARSGRSPVNPSA